MAHASRYRLEGTTRCVDIRLRNRRQIFDNRDPAPFRERDLDPSAVDALLTAASEIRRQFPMKIVLHFSEDDPLIDDVTMSDALRAHFAHELELADRRISENFRLGRRLIAIGLTVLGFFLTLSELMTKVPLSTLRDVLREGLTIMGWVAMWRPVEVLFYDWLPLVEHRRNIRRLLAASIEIRSISEADRASALPSA